MVCPHFFSLELMVVDIVEFIWKRVLWGNGTCEVRLIHPYIGWVKRVHRGTLRMLLLHDCQTRPLPYSVCYLQLRKV
jgi:hypothetical protein